MLRKPPRRSLEGLAFGEWNSTDRSRASDGRSRRFLLQLLLAIVLLSSILRPCFLLGQNPVLTYHADPARSGLYPTETLLTPANVNSTQFGRLFSYAVDGFVAGQPLYVSNVAIPGLGTHNVVYITTQHDSVYAFDADNLGSGTPLWHVSFINPSAGVTSVPMSEQLCFETGFSEIGIMGTPVINQTTGSSGATGTLYVVAKTKEVSGSTTNYIFRLHALDITTGLEQFGGPVVISASLTAPNGNIDTFPLPKQYQRPALLLQGGIVYIGFGSNGCDFNAWGWLFAMDSGIVSGTLQQLAFFNADPNQPYGASMWMSGSGPAGDGAGNVFLSTANGTFDFSTGGPDLGDSILKLSYTGGVLGLEDYFTPSDQENMAAHDLDLGSGGVMLLPPQPGPNPNLLVQAGKTGTIYLVNRDAPMGEYNETGNANVQFLTNALGHVYSTPTYWNNVVYFTALNDVVKGFTLNNGLLSNIPSMISNRVYSGGIPLISANGSTNGILWAVFNTAQPTLYAFDGASLLELYSSEQRPRDVLGLAAHFVTPIVANGKVYVGTQTQLVAYGLRPFLTPTAGNNQSGTVGTVLPVALSVQAVNSSGAGVPGVVVNFSDGGRGGTFSNPTGTTDSTGTATTSYTLPKRAQSFTIKATASGYLVGSFAELAVVGPPAAIVVVSGIKQTGTAGSPLPAPIAVRIKDQYNNSLPGLPVSFIDGGVGGTFSTNPVNTDATGTATVSYTLPTRARSVIVNASYSTLQVLLPEKGVAGSPASQKLVSGNNQTGAPNTQLTKPLIVDVMDTYGNPVSGVSVGFSDGSAGGVFSVNPVITGSNGQASVTYTTPSVTGSVSVTASVSGINSVTFQETVQ
jgi:hypothetical protein